MRSRRQRERSAAAASQQVSGRPLQFSDRTDAVAGAGEIPTASLAQRPRAPFTPFGQLQRLADLDSDSRGMGARLAPMQTADGFRELRQLSQWRGNGRRLSLLARVAPSSKPRAVRGRVTPHGLLLNPAAVRLAMTRILRESSRRSLNRLPALERNAYVCMARKARRESLFASGVAGHNRRLSRGRRGTYRRVLTSNQSCR